MNGGPANSPRRPFPARWALGLAAAVVVAAGCSAPVLGGVPRPAPEHVRESSGSVTAGRPVAGRPNLLLVTTDDQNVGDLRWMPRTRRLLARHGMTFTDALSPHPLCCPARAEILTGQYAQNNGVLHNHGPYGGAPRLDATQTIATWLRDAGYRTGFVGKYLNEFGPRSPRPAGWTAWDPMVARVYDYYGTVFDDEGTPRRHDRYSGAVVSDRTVDYIHRFAGRRKPFFIWSSHVAPHAVSAAPGQWGPPLAPRRDTKLAPGVVAPSLRKPSFDVQAEPEPDCVCESGSWSRGYVQHYFRQRMAALGQVDRSVAAAVRALRQEGALDDTFIFFTSDNAYLLGEHGFIGKSLLYEEDLRVPLVVRGPRVVAGRTSPEPVTLVDLAPTFLDLAGARATLVEDGATFVPVLRGRRMTWRDTQLIQTGSVQTGGFAPGWGYRGVRTARYTFGFDQLTWRTVLFDRRRDPFEMTNVAGLRRYDGVERELARRTVLLSRCAGAGCNRRFGPVQ